MYVRQTFAPSFLSLSGSVNGDPEVARKMKP